MLALDELIANSKELSSLPEIYIRVSELLDDANSTSEQIGAVVQTDPAITARILKVVNSSFYGFPSEIATISQAISILGRNPLRQILTGAVLGGVFSRLSNDVFLMDDFWQHSVLSAVMAKYCYANIVGRNQSDELFIAGLIHDIGRLIIAHQLPEQSMAIQRTIDTEDNLNIIDIEQQALGFTHSDVGAAIMKKWGLPKLLQTCALNHHTPNATEEFKKEVWILYIANSLANIPVTAEDQDIINTVESLTGWEQSGLTLKQICEAYTQSFEHYQMVIESLGL